jgi:hypothetical protein
LCQSKDTTYKDEDIDGDEVEPEDGEANNDTEKQSNEVSNEKTPEQASATTTNNIGDNSKGRAKK